MPGFAVLVLAASLFLVACEATTVQNQEAEAQAALPAEPIFVQPPPEPEPEPEPIPAFPVTRTQGLLPAGFTPSARVALLVPLSGQHARVGQALLNAAQLALFDVADDGLALIARDTRGTPEGAAEAVSSALDEGATLILGPLFASSVRVVGAAAESRGVNVVGFSNDVTVAGGNVFVMGITPGAQVLRVVDYAGRKGHRRFAVLAPSTAYGQAVIQAMQAAVNRVTGQLTRVVTYDPAAPDITPEVRSLAQYDQRRRALQEQHRALRARGDEASRLALKRLKNLDTLGKPDFDAVLLPVGGGNLLSIAPSLAYYDIDPAEVRYLGTALWDDPKLGTEPTLTGGWFAAPSPANWDTFKRRYETAFDGAPPRIASLAYDAAALAALLARNGTESQSTAFTVESLTQPSGFSGVDGIFRFLPDGRVERGLAVLEMRRDQFTVLENAPRSFERLAF